MWSACAFCLRLPCSDNVICFRFASVNLSANQNLTPTFVYKREMLTRYVVIIEDTKDMMERVCIARDK